MNREIKFRAWDTGIGVMRDWDWMQNVTHGALWTSCDLDIMQYTGLKDKNGKEIYEGDILKNTKHKNQLVEVYWRGCLVGASSVNGKNWIDWGGWKFRKLNEDNDFTYTIYQDSIEVIGNIYENPELLE